MLERLDKLLVQRDLVSTRTRAEQLIREVGVLVNGKLITKTGRKYDIDCTIELVKEEIPWVSRGALKLIKAIEHWSPKIENGIWMDVGASTGGFTEVLLHHNVLKIYAIDVGSKQMHERIKNDNRVLNLEKTHVRELNFNVITDHLDGCVIDVSFISLDKVFPFIHPYLKSGSTVIALVKPQFEVGKEHIAKGGIVRNKKIYPEVIEKIIKHALLSNLTYQEHIESPILGGDGNQEFLMLLQKQ